VLHIIDGSHPQYEEQRVVGEEVLRSLGIGPEKVVDVYNKADVMEVEDRRSRLSGQAGLPVLHISAATGRGIDRLIEVIRERELAGGEVLELEIPHRESRALAKLHEVAVVFEERAEDRGTRVTAWIPQNAVHLFANFSIANLLQRAKVS
jgi:GTP-binding protein HflX